VNFSFSDEQLALRAAVRQVLDAQCPVAALRALDAASPERRAELSGQRWRVIAELGAPALLVPEDAGGLGLSEVDLVGVLEEAGWAALPEPLL
jgi:alkylation response protein AidB-like acyl-CoA dehydrogenase